MCSHRERADRAHAAFSSARAELLSAIAEVIETQAWHGDGAVDPASWLCGRWQISLRTARELVRDAQALAERPVLVAALAAGSVSTDQCRALAVLGDAASDDRALENLPFWSYAELEREARKETARKLEHRDGGTYLRMHATGDERFVRGEFQLHPEDGATLIAAIDARIPTNTPIGDLDHASANALVELAMGSAPARQQRPTVILADTVAELASGTFVGAETVAELSSGGVVGAETARRLACDANLAGQPVPSSTRRAVEARDGHRCTFPGCGRDVYLHCHHIVHRADGGSNDASNLQLVCWQHHKLIHEGGWSLRGEAGPKLTWVRPDGTNFDPRPPP